MEKNQKSSAEEMLRQLRQRYSSDATPEEVFSDAAPVKDEDDSAFDDEISAKFNSLFGDTAVKPMVEEPVVEVAEQEIITPEQQESEAVPMDEPEGTEVLAQEAGSSEEEITPEAEIEAEATADEEPATVDEQTIEEQMTEEPTKENEPGGETLPDSAPAVTAAETPLAEEPEAVVQEDSESSKEQQVTSDDTDGAVQEQADEEENELPDPVVLREDEVLLDEFEDLPAEPVADDPPAESVVSIAPEADIGAPAPVKPRPSPLDAAMQAQRKKDAAQAPRRSPALREAETLSDEDVALLLSLGYENELNKRVESDRIEKIKHEPLQVLTDRQRGRRAFAYRGKEYESAADRDTVTTAYQKSRTAIVWRLVLTILFALVTLVWDMAPYYASYLPTVIADIATAPVSHLLGLQLLVLCVAPSLPSVWYGIRQLLRLNAEPCSVVAPTLLVTALYDVLVTFLSERVIALNFPVAVMMVLLVMGELMDINRERVAFSVVSSSENKVVLTELEPRKKKVLRDGRIVKIINDQIDSKLYSVDKTSHVDGYFRRTNTATPRYRSIAYLLGAQPVIALLVAGISMLHEPSLLSAGTAFVVCMQLCTPAALLLSFAYPLLLATRRLATKKATVLGHATADEMAGDRTLLFDDSEMLQAKSSTEITVKGSGDPKKFVRYARRLFHAVGGTLSKITTSDLSDDMVEGGVEILRVTGDGLEARIDGRVRVLVGSSAFMVRNNIRVPRSNAELLARKNDESSILYLAFGGQIRLGYEINYRIHGNFEHMVSILGAGSTAVAIRSCDPNLTDEYLSNSRAHRTHPVNVIKPVRFEARTVSASRDSGVVATGSAKNIAFAVRMCELLLACDRHLSLVQRIMMTAGSLAVVALSLTGMMDQSISAIAAVLLLIFCLPVPMLARKDLWIESTSTVQNAKQGGKNQVKKDNNDKK